MSRHHSASSANQAQARLLLAAFVLLASGCRPAGAGASGAPSLTGASPTPSAASSEVVAIDCPALGSKAPTEAASAFRAAGYRVFWRRVHTATDGTTLNDIVSQPPPNTIIADIVLDAGRGDAYIFVADPADPAAHYRSSPHC